MTFRLSYRLKANSLFYSTVIALVIAFISSAIILLAYLNRSLVFHTLEEERVQTNALSGINLLMADEGEWIPNGEAAIDLYGKGNDSVLVKKIRWGLFEVAVSKAVSKKHQSTLITAFGFAPDSATWSSLYLADQNRPLSLCGKTVIKGDCYLPEAGVRRAYIEGQSFTGNQLIDGATRKSRNMIPPFNKEKAEDVLSVFSRIENYIAYESLQSDSVVRSFADSTLVLFSDNKINLIGGFYKGNIMLVSGKSVFIGAAAQLEDVLVYAPEIIVESGFHGNLQLFAEDSIRIQDSCQLAYPSAVCLFQTKDSGEEPEISIGEHCSIRGMVFIFQLESAIRQPMLSIGKETVAEGQVYADGIVELKGNVYGNLTCSKILLRTPSSIYENHLLNVTVDCTRLSPHFAGSSLLAYQPSKKIIKWLY